MSEVKDDPREVLALLNSLGFVGVTALQLKAFMKDLKLYRKVKQHERQQWKEETRRKILKKQQRAYKDILHERTRDRDSNIIENTISSESSTHQDESMIKIKIRYIPDNKENQETKDASNYHLRSERSNESARAATSWITELSQRDFRRLNNDGRDSPSSITESRWRVKRSENQCKLSTNDTNYPILEGSKCRINVADRSTKPSTAKTLVQTRPASAPDLTEQARRPRPKSTLSDPAGNVAASLNQPAESKNSARSQHKSFIRPWRLQPDVQKSSTIKRMDPVTLYQKYQHEWKQLAFPGEERHASVRWAVREKMLGSDPNPRPVMTKSHSMMTIGRR